MPQIFTCTCTIIKKQAVAISTFLIFSHIFSCFIRFPDACLQFSLLYSLQICMHTFIKWKDNYFLIINVSTTFAFMFSYVNLLLHLLPFQQPLSMVARITQGCCSRFVFDVTDNLCKPCLYIIITIAIFTLTLQISMSKSRLFVLLALPAQIVHLKQ